MEEKNTSTGTAAEDAPSAAPGTGCFLCDVAMPILEHFWSDATSDHFRNSRIEFLKGIRSLLDQRIEYLSRRPSPRQGTHVTVE